jgi:transcriptional regulator with XRE-family HTH domain
LDSSSLPVDFARRLANNGDQRPGRLFHDDQGSPGWRPISLEFFSKCGRIMAKNTVPADGQKICELRQDKGWSQEDLAIETSKVKDANGKPMTITKRTIENAEKNSDVQLRTLHAIAAALGVEPKQIRGKEAIASPRDELTKEAEQQQRSQTHVDPKEGNFNLKHFRKPPAKEMFGRKGLVQALDEAWDSGKVRIYRIEGLFGVGKTTFVYHWMKGRDWLEEEVTSSDKPLVFGWSFDQEGGTKYASASDFMTEALIWFAERLGKPEPKERALYDVRKQLIRLVTEKRSLLVLDGLEALQTPQGELSDRELEAFLYDLAGYPSGECLCVLTTRLTLTEDKFKCYEGDGRETIRCLNRELLKRLEPEAAIEVLNSLGVTGTPEEKQEAADWFGFHAKSLELLAGLLHRRFNGRAECWRDVRELLGKTDDKVRRMLDLYAKKWLKKDTELAVMLLLGLFNRPALHEEVKALCDPPIKRLTDRLPEWNDSSQWNELLAGLYKLFSLFSVTHCKSIGYASFSV